MQYFIVLKRYKLIIATKIYYNKPAIVIVLNSKIYPIVKADLIISLMYECGGGR